eukprot:178031-Pelagomonas_calceolata.AAC.4
MEEICMQDAVGVECTDEGVETTLTKPVSKQGDYAPGNFTKNIQQDELPDINVITYYNVEDKVQFPHKEPTHPLRVALRLANAVLALSQGVPQADGLVART